MNQTIRDYIERRVWWCAASAVGGWLMFPLGAAIAQSLPEGVVRAAVPIVGFVIFGGAILALQRFAPAESAAAAQSHSVAIVATAATIAVCPKRARRPDRISVTD